MERRRSRFQLRLSVREAGDTPRRERRRHARLRRRPLGHGVPIQAGRVDEPPAANHRACTRHGLILNWTECHGLRLCTQVYGAYAEKVYRQITPTKAALNEAATTPAECATLVRRDHPTATAAEYSNVGGDWCSAVFDA